MMKHKHTYRYTSCYTGRCMGYMYVHSGGHLSYYQLSKLKHQTQLINIIRSRVLLN